MMKAIRNKAILMRRYPVKGGARDREIETETYECVNTGKIVGI